MTRETKTITTTSGKSVVFNSYLTGKEMNTIKGELLKGQTSSGEIKEKLKLSLEKFLPYERAQLDALVISVDGVTESPVDILENLPNDEYQDAVSQIKEAAKISLAEAK